MILSTRCRQLMQKVGSLSVKFLMKLTKSTQSLQSDQKIPRRGELSKVAHHEQPMILHPLLNLTSCAIATNARFLLTF